MKQVISNWNINVRFIKKNDNAIDDDVEDDDDDEKAE